MTVMDRYGIIERAVLSGCESYFVRVPYSCAECKYFDVRPTCKFVTQYSNKLRARDGMVSLCAIVHGFMKKQNDARRVVSTLVNAQFVVTCAVHSIPFSFVSY